MASGAISAQGTEFAIGSGLHASTGTTYTNVADVEDIQGPTEQNRFIEITNHASSAVERIPTLNDPGGLTLQLSFGPGSATHGSTGGLRNLLRNQTQRGFRLKYPVATGQQFDKFDGYVSSFEVSAPTADVLRATCEIQITGPITSTTSS